MEDAAAMRLAIDEARKCNWEGKDLDDKPKVGAVIVIGDREVARAHRETDDHAEMLTLQRAFGEPTLAGATVFTTLEPCTGAVRIKPRESCTAKLISAGVKRVVLGMLDPNQDVCGRGVLQLQEANIAVELFPNELARELRWLNERFREAQEDLGIEIISPESNDVYTMGYLTVRGTYKKPPKSDVFAMTYVSHEDSLGLGAGLWPQEQVRVVPYGHKQWEASVHFGAPVRHRVVIIRANDLGLELINMYVELTEIRKRVIHTVANLYCRDLDHVRVNIARSFWSLPMSSKPPKGLDIQASVNIQVRGGDPAGQSVLIR